MEDAQFWSLIAESKRGAQDCDQQAERLRNLLVSLSPEEIYDFDRHFARRHAQAYHWDLWAVAYIINGGCSDDGFAYFRCWLIGQGQKAFEMALASPETVGDLVQGEEPDIECEALLYAAGEAYEYVTGRYLPEREGGFSLSEPSGERWEEDDLPRLYPRLCERFWR
jgi:hypothetical protein